MSEDRDRIVLPEGFDDFAWEVEAKGWLPEVLALIQGSAYRVTFYDPARLAQDLDEELGTGEVFFERNLLVIPAVTPTHMRAAIASLARSGRFAQLKPIESDAE